MLTNFGFGSEPVGVIPTEEAYPMSKGLRLDAVKNYVKNDQHIKSNNFCFGSEALRVIPTEEAYPGPIGLRSDAVKNYVKMISTSSRTTFVLVLKLSE